MTALRPYQHKAIEDLRASLKRSRASILCMKTGLGKTVVAGYIASSLARSGKSALVLVHKRELLRQFCDVLDEVGLGGEYGVLQAGRPESPWAKFQVGSVPTMIRRNTSHLSPNILIIDECHHVKASSWEKVIARYPEALRLGLSATPARLDGKPIADHFNEIVHGPSFGASVEGGFLAPVDTVWDEQPMDRKGIRVRAGDYDAGEMGKRVNGKVVAHAYSAWQRHTADLDRPQGLFFGVNIPHSKRVAEEFRQAGVMAEHIDGTMKSSHRDVVMQAYKDRTIQVLCNVGIADEGVDVPDAEVLLDAAPTMSIVRYKQKVGRIMRPKPDGRSSLHIDLAWNVWEHGLAQDEDKWTLDVEARIPEDVKPPASRLRVCEECAHVFSRSRPDCPSCGKLAPAAEAPTEIERTLSRVSVAKRKETPKAHMRRELARIASLGSGAAARKEVHRLAYESGFTQNWAVNIIDAMGL